MPLIPSGLSSECRDVIDKELLIQCVHGWGWTQKIDGFTSVFHDDALAMGRISVVPEAYIDFTAPRCGITGKVVRAPAPYQISRFVAFIMSDGVDFDFTRNIAPSWRVIVGNGQLDLDSTWFPTLKGEDPILGYGSVGEDEGWLGRAGHLVDQQSEQAVDARP